MQRIKLSTMAVLAMLGLIVILQNTDQVQTRILLWSITMPRAVLLVGTLLIGFALGVITTFFFSNRGTSLSEHDQHRNS